MRELHAVLDASGAHFSQLKSYLLIFDKLWTVPFGESSIPDKTAVNDVDFLLSSGFIQPVGPDPRLEFGLTELGLRMVKVSLDATESQRGPDPGREGVVARIVAAALNQTECDAVALCAHPMPDSIPPNFLAVFRQASALGDTLRVAFKSFPVPDEQSAWQDIIEFKAENHDKQWAFRRFLNTLATKGQSEAEIRDDIEWSLNEYSKAMDRSKIKRSISFMETYIIPTVEALESLKPSSLLKGLVAIKKRKLELLDGEASTPGRECAYVFDARNRFGSK